jgi:hypothetical protein
MNDAGSGYDERAAAQPQHELAAPFDEKRDAPSLESDSIQSQDRRAKGTEIAQPNETTDAEEAAGTSKEGEKLALQRSKSVTNAASIPDGGLVAWLQVLGAFFLLFNSWYVTHSLLVVLQTTGTADLLTIVGASSTHSVRTRRTTKPTFSAPPTRRLSPG